MMIRELAWLWRASGAVCEDAGRLMALRRIGFLAQALGVYSSIKPMLSAPRGSALAKLLEDRPETVGAVIWPYQCCAWDARTRLARIVEHYSVAESIGGCVNFPVGEERLLVDLAHIREGFRVIVDQPKWFLREGQLVLNLFLGEERIYSLAFSFFRQAGSIAVFIGAIQGRDIKGINDVYRELTKLSHGMRPRDLVIEVFRMFCAELCVAEIFAVSDECRHHRAGYFGNSADTKVSSNYNEIWEDRGGRRIDLTCYSLDVHHQERDISSIPSKKRSLYRRRYEVLQSIRQQMHLNLVSANHAAASLRRAQ
jgi:uncharacterized protein